MEEENFTKSDAEEHFLTKFGKDLKNKENWKLKAVYFFLLSGIVALWVQLTIHQSSLNFTDRDVADFVSMSAIVPMVIPFVTGVVADKIGNFSKLVAVLIVLLGVNSFCFTIVKPITFLKSECETNQLEAFHKAIMQSTTNLTYFESSAKCIYQKKFEAETNHSSKFNHDKNCESLSELESDVKDKIFEIVFNHTIFGKCNNVTDKTRDPDSYTKTYWIYITIYGCFIALVGASYSLFDGTVMALQQESFTDYGLQRAWGTLAALMSSVMGGKLVDIYSAGSDTKDFTLMFYSAGICFIIAGLITFSINISFKLPATDFSKEFWNEFKNFEMIILMLLIVLKGAIMAYVETFMYLFMAKLGASSFLIGLTITVGASFEIGLQLLATPLMKLLGNVTVISIGLLCYSIRFIGFSYAYNPIVIVSLEVLDSWASGLTLTAIVMYCAILSSSATVASMRGLVSILHDGIGRFLGPKIGIEIKDGFTDRVAWRIMSLFALLVAITYFIIVKLYKKFIKIKLSSQNVVAKNSHTREDDNSEYDPTRENCHSNPAFQI